MELKGVYSVCFLLFVSAVTTCSAQSLACVTAYNPSINYFPNGSLSAPFELPLNEVAVNTALDFTVGYANSYKVVKNNMANTSYVLHQCGTPAPAKTSYPAGTRFFQVPMQSYAIDTTIPVAYLELLGVVNLMKYAEVSTGYISSPCVQKLAASGAIKDLSDPFFGNATLYSIEAAQVNAVIDADQTPNNFTNLVSFDASGDPGPLKRAEWIKFLALFFNLEARANTVFASVQASYQCLNGSVNATSKPVVAWLSYYLGAWTVSSSTYKLQLDSDAGALNVPATSIRLYNMSLAADVTAFKALLTTLDVVIDESYAADPTTYTLSNFTSSINLTSADSYKFLANSSVWREDRRTSAGGGLDWFEGALPQPQVVLKDLIGVFHPSVATNFTYFRNIAKGENVTVLTAADCTGNPTALLDPVVIACPIKVSSPPPAPASPPAPANIAPVTASPPPTKGSQMLHSMPLLLLAATMLASLAFGF